MPAESELREATTLLTRAAVADLRRLWTPGDSARASRDALADLMPLLVEAYGTAAGAAAADWYDASREESEARGRFTAIATAPETGGLDVTSRWATGPLFSAEPNAAAALTLASGALERRVADAARRTVTGSSAADPAADGWQRQARAGACGFCQMLAGRGAVYSEASADFGSHDHCHCTAVPAWKGRPRPVKPYVPSARSATDADRARTRDWLRASGLA